MSLIEITTNSIYNKKDCPKKGFITYYDDSRWPIVYLGTNGRVNNLPDFQTFTEKWSSFYVRSSETKKRFRFIFDVRELKKVDIKYLLGIAKFLKEVKTLTDTWMDRTAVFVSSWKIRKMIHFVLKIYKPIRPFKVFMDNEIQEMERWIASNEDGEEVLPIENISEDELKDCMSILEDNQ